jgi:hypothetical protein
LVKDALFLSMILTCLKNNNMVHNLLFNYSDNILDHRGWYNRKDLQFMKIERLIMLSAMGPPGGGRTFITPRLVRHFNVIAYT